MKRNVIRELLNEGKPTIGTHLQNMWPGYVEVVGHTGMFDYIEFFATDAVYNLFTLDDVGRTLGLFDHMSGMVKLPQELRTYLVERTIGAGFHSILFADIRTADDAREAVAAARPDVPNGIGIHGWADRRNVGFGADFDPNEYIQSLNDVVVVLIIEKKRGVENLEQILEVPGIDMICFGPADYSLSIGLAGKAQDPAVKEAEMYTYESAIKNGLLCRPDVGSVEAAKPYMEMGIKDFCIGSDLKGFYDYCLEQGKGIATALDQ